MGGTVHITACDINSSSSKKAFHNLLTRQHMNWEGGVGRGVETRYFMRKWAWHHSLSLFIKWYMYSFLSENSSNNFILLNWGQGVAIGKIMRSTSCAHIIVLGIGYVHKNKSSAAVAHLQIRGLFFFTSSSDDSIVIRFLMAENCSSYLSFPFTDVDLTSGRRVLAESASGHGQSAINMRIVRFVICKKCKRVFERRPRYGPAADGEKWKYNTEIRRDGISYLVYYNDVRYFVRWKCIICD